jgi:uncharacterized protein YecT (DUF1311 family)
MAKSDKPDYVLVYDGEGGVRMAPAGTRVEVPPEPHINWPPEPDLRLPEATVTAPRRPAYVLPVVGAACLCVAGLGLGFVARPRLEAVSAPPPAPMQPVAGRMQVAVSPPTPAAVTPSTTRLEVLPPEQRRPAARTAATAPRFPSARTVAADSPPQAAADASAVEPFDTCQDGRSPAEAMVCADPDLARADRRLARAFRAAARSGVPLRQLRAEQDDWLEIREDAAQHSPRAVAQVYDQRIEELEAMAAAAEPR